MAEVRKRHFLSTFSEKTVILPRQARDKHRESTQKENGRGQEATQPPLLG
jgi:hypothetical protein